jgi:hypothetical protein
LSASAQKQSEANPYGEDAGDGLLILADGHMPRFDPLSLKKRDMFSTASAMLRRKLPGKTEGCAAVGNRSR